MAPQYCFTWILQTAFDIDLTLRLELSLYFIFWGEINLISSECCSNIKQGSTRIVIKESFIIRKEKIIAYFEKKILIKFLQEFCDITIYFFAYKAIRLERTNMSFTENYSQHEKVKKLQHKLELKIRL